MTIKIVALDRDPFLFVPHSSQLKVVDALLKFSTSEVSHVPRLSAPSRYTSAC